MECRHLALLLGLVLLLTAWQPVQGRIEYSHIWRDDRPLIPITAPFAFADRGHIDITLKDIGMYRRHDQVESDYSLANFGFFLSSWDGQMALDQDLLAGKCVLQDQEHKLFTFADRKVAAVIEGKNPNITFHVDIKDGGRFFLYFANCEPYTPVSFAIRVEQYNLVGPNGRKDYLSVGETELNVVYWVMAGLFALLTAAWLLLLLRPANKQQVFKIHWLMAALVFFKTLTLMTQAIVYQVMEQRGSAHGWNWVFHISDLFRGLLFFAVLVLIGTGWSYMKPFIDDRTRQVLMIVIPLQVLANLALVITEEESPAIRDWLTWRDIFHFVDILCCCAILFPIVWSIKQLREASETDGKAARCLEKLKLFRQFYVIVIVFIYFTRIIVYLLRNTLAYQHQWVSDFISCLAYLAFYVWVGVRFRPNADNPYTKISHQEEIEMGL